MYDSPDPCESLAYVRNLELTRERNSKNGIVKNLVRREISGKQLHLTNPFGASYPDRFRMPIEQIIPRYALEAGNIFMGFTDCGRYLMSYTARPSDNFGVSWGELTFTYRLHFWLFVPYKAIRKISSVTLFDDNGVVDNNLLIEISHWKNDDQRILVTGHSSNPDGDIADSNHTQFYATITTIPPTANCAECKIVLDEEVEEESGNVESRILQPCLRHGLTIHLTFDHVSPFPRFDSEVQLRFQNSVCFNTGNVLHVFSFKLLEPQLLKSSSTNASSSPRNNSTHNPNDIAPLLQLQQTNGNNTAGGGSSGTNNSSNNSNASNRPLPLLRCDLWFKSNNYSLSTIINKGPIRDDTKFYHNYKQDGRPSSSFSASYFLDALTTSEEANILSINAQESFLAILPYMNTANQKTIMNHSSKSAFTLPIQNLVRRLSQNSCSLDSLDFSSAASSPPPPSTLISNSRHSAKSTSTLPVNKSNNITCARESSSSSLIGMNKNSQTDSQLNSNGNRTSNNISKNAQNSPHKVCNVNNSSPKPSSPLASSSSSPNSKKLMLPPSSDGERKFFKRRISNISSPVKQNVLNNLKVSSPDKASIKSSYFNFTNRESNSCKSPIINTNSSGLSKEKLNTSSINDIKSHHNNEVNVITYSNSKTKLMTTSSLNNNQSINSKPVIESSSSNSTSNNKNNISDRAESTNDNITSNTNSGKLNVSSSSSAYDVFEISVGGEDILQESFRTFSSFRKRRLADKKYEFSEADVSSENIVPLKLVRMMSRKTSGLISAEGGRSDSSLLGGLGSPRSPRYEQSYHGNESPRHLVVDNVGSSNIANYINMNPRSPRGGSHYVLSPAMSPNSGEFQPDVLRPININNNLNSNMNVKLPNFSPNQNNSSRDSAEDWLDFGLNSPTGSVGDVEKTKQQSDVISNNNSISCSQVKSRSRGNTPKRTFQSDDGKMILKHNSNNSNLLQQNISDNNSNNSSNVSTTTTITNHQSHPSMAHSLEKDSNSNSNAKPIMGVSINCIAKVLRSYVERESEEDDNVSVITDIEDDIHGDGGNSGQPFPVALPLEVHGTAYGALNMISNAKAEKCQVPVVQVLQRTLDIELLCNEVAGIICHSANKYYCSCCDYDVAIVDVCPEKGTITAVVFVLVQAASLNLKSPGRCYDRNVHAGLGYQDPRKKYEAVFSFAWEPEQEYCRILYLGNLLELELNAVSDPWHPTRHILSLIKICSQGSVRGYGGDMLETRTKVLNNHLAVHDFLSVEELTDSRGMITLYLNKTQKTEPFHSPRSASVSITDDSDEED